MASPSTLSRACKACNQLKVRCHPSPSDADTCERCQHLGRECVPAGKRRRPRDRIAELEAQVAGLTKALQNHQVSPQHAGVLADGKSHYEAGQRTTSPVGVGHVPLKPSGGLTIALLDRHVSIAMQQQAVDTYIQHVFPLFPAIPLAQSDLARLRSESPVLLFSVTAFATSYILSTDTRNELIQEAMRIFASELISRPRRRLELVGALLVAASWFRARPGVSHVTIHQLVQLATGMAVDIGIGGTQIPITPGAGGSETRHPSSLDAQRTWLACFVDASTISIAIRRYDANVQWTTRHDHCLAGLDVSSTEKTDHLFAHIVRGERLCHQIATSLALCDPNYLWDLTSDESQHVTSKIRKDIDEWTAGICSGTGHRPLLFCRWSAIVYLNEPVLHTSTNKMTFGAPPRPEKVAESDFPSPIVTGQHVTALYALRDSCQAILDLATEPATTAFLAICPLPYIARVFHALFLLIKLYVSITAPGNTYGTILRPTELRLEQYFENMKILTTSIEHSNPDSFNARIFSCHFALEAWFTDYIGNLSCPRTDRVASAEETYQSNEISTVDHYAREGEQATSETGQFEWLILDDYHMSNSDFILDS